MEAKNCDHATRLRLRNWFFSSLLKVGGASGDIPQNVNFGIAWSALREFLDVKGVGYKAVDNDGELSGVQIAGRTSALTLLIEFR
jgi:hypothetical protein